MENIIIAYYFRIVYLAIVRSAVCNICYNIDLLAVYLENVRKDASVW